MAFYGDIYYGTTYYGSDEFGNGSGRPENLLGYQNNIDTVVLYWLFDPCSINLHRYVWEVQTDLVETFDSPDLRTYHSNELLEIDAPLILGNTISVVIDSGAAIAAPLIVDNVISLEVDSVVVSATFDTDSNTTLANLAQAIAAEPKVSRTSIYDVGAGTDDDRKIVIVAADRDDPPVLSNLSVTGGASQTTFTIFTPTVSVPFNTDSNTTLADLATAMTAEPKISLAWVRDAGAGTDDDRVIVVEPVDVEDPPAYSALSVTGGASQAAFTVAASSTLVPARVNRGVAIPVYDRLQGEERRMYWRVRGLLGGVESLWATSVFDIPMAIDGQTRDAMLELLPEVPYRRDAESNTYGLHYSFGESLDLHWIEDLFVNNDYSTALIRDASMAGKMSPMLNLSRPGQMMMIDYREIVRTLMIEARNSPVTKAVRALVRAMLCVNPTFERISDDDDGYVEDETAGQVVAPSYIEDTGNSVEGATLWDDQNLAYGMIVNVSNPLGAFITRAYAEEVIRKVVQAHVPVYVVGI